MSSYNGSMSTMQSDLFRGIVADIKILTVDRLKKVLRNETLGVSGVKEQLQNRLITYVEDFQKRQDLENLHRIKHLVRAHSGTFGNPYPSPYSNHTPASSASPQFNSPTPRQPAAFGMPHPKNGLTFKSSPFYSITGALCPVQELKPREQTRDTAKVTINLDATLAAQLASDQNMRVMVFCVAETFDPTWKPVDIAFPQHADLKCNQEEVKANLRGLKNKPGSTRPADVTPQMRKKPGFPNTIELMSRMSYPNSPIPPAQKFYMVVNLVKRTPIPSLLAELKHKKALSKERVLRDMQRKSKDDDVVATSSNMSLRDPVQMTRIETPCRSNVCKHNECFDAAVFLALQEQAPTWTCPICNRPASWENIVYDQFVQEILDNTSKTALQVTVEPDGKWRLLQEEQDTDDDDDGERLPTKRRKLDYEDGDDDLIEISSIKSESWPTPSFHPFNNYTTSSGLLTPSGTGREHASTTQASSSQQQPSNKRQRIDIDLTLSDDDDDEPPVSRVQNPSLTTYDSNVFGRHSEGEIASPHQLPSLNNFLPLPLPRPSSAFGQVGWTGSPYGNHNSTGERYFSPFGGMR